MSIDYRLELFVVGQSVKGEAADRNVRRVCDALLPGRYELQVIDVLENTEAAEAANIVATPALVRRLPLPVRVVVGDLSERATLLLGLGLDDDGDPEGMDLDE